MFNNQNRNFTIKVKLATVYDTEAWWLNFLAGVVTNLNKNCIENKIKSLFLIFRTIFPWNLLGKVVSKDSVQVLQVCVFERLQRVCVQLEVCSWWHDILQKFPSICMHTISLSFAYSLREREGARLVSRPRDYRTKWIQYSVCWSRSRGPFWKVTSNGHPLYCSKYLTSVIWKKVKIISAERGWYLMVWKIK